MMLEDEAEVAGLNCTYCDDTGECAGCEGPCQHCHTNGSQS
jgi:hypothetical protein